ncbi:MAG TPA: thioredoxin domain-containing protein [Patescibacteria group bacterium]
MTRELRLGTAAVIITAALIAIFAFSAKSKPNVARIAQSIDTTGAIARGPENAPITIIEYTDFQCPSCKQLYPTLETLLKEYDGKIRFIHRHFPLMDIHYNAYDAAMASEAAKDQGRFWDMHNLLFERQGEWANAKNPNIVFERYASELGLSLPEYRTFVEEQKGKDAIDRDVAEGETLGVTSTPTLFLNGKGMSGVPEYADLKLQILEILATSSPTPAP